MSKFRGSITLSIFSLSTLSNYHYWQSPKTRYWRLVRPYQTGIPPARLLALIWAHSPDLLSSSLYFIAYRKDSVFYETCRLGTACSARCPQMVSPQKGSWQQPAQRPLFDLEQTMTAENHSPPARSLRRTQCTNLWVMYNCTLSKLRGFRLLPFQQFFQ